MNISPIQYKIENYLREEIVRIFQNSDEPPQKLTILGSSINQIRHIFYYLKNQRVPIRVSYQMDTFFGVIKNVEDLMASIELPNFEETDYRRIIISFNFFNAYYSFEVSFYKVEKNLIYFFLPLNIQYFFRRKYPRIIPEENFTAIQVIYQNIFQEKEVEFIFNQNFSILKSEIEKDYPNLESVLRIFFSYINKISESYTFVLYKDFKKNKSLQWLENQLNAIKKTIYVENTDNLHSYYSLIHSNLLTNFERIYKNMLKTQSEEDVIKFFEKIQREDIRNQKNSYIISPIFLFEKLFGYIYLETSYIDRKKIFFSDAIHIAILTKVLSYTMEKILFFEKFYLEGNVKLINISLSGALLNIPSEIAYKYLIQNDLLKFTTELQNSKITCISHITRMFTKEESNYFIAIHFLEYIEDSFSLLEKAIYNISSKKRGLVMPPTTEFRE